MARKTEEPARPSLVEQLLPGFEPLSALWQGEAALYESDQAVRWLVRKHNERFAAVQAVALWNGRIYVHRERFLSVLREHALTAYRDRYIPSVSR